MDKDVLKVLTALGLETKANEVVHTTNTGFGKELIPVDVLQQEIFDAVPTYSQFLGILPGYHGMDMPISAKVAVVGDPGFYDRNSEWTTGAPTPDQAIKKQPTAEVTIEQGQFIASVAISKRELNYAIGDIEALVKRKLSEAAARTIDAYILNADPTTAATGNVNSDDAAPAGTEYYLEGGAAGGVRKVAIDDSATVNVGTFDFADFISALNFLGDYAAKPEDVLVIMNRATYNKALGITEFKDASQNGKASTIHTGAITNVLGSDIFIARDLPKTEADGKVSVTPANNIKGQFALVWKSAIQYGYGQAFELDVVKVPGKGIQIFATFEFGFDIVQKKAGQTDSSVSLGINVDL